MLISLNMTVIVGTMKPLVISWAGNSVGSTRTNSLEEGVSFNGLWIPIAIVMLKCGQEE